MRHAKYTPSVQLIEDMHCVLQITRLHKKPRLIFIFCFLTYVHFCSEFAIKTALSIYHCLSALSTVPHTMTSFWLWTRRV